MSAPLLPATSIDQDSYGYMFEGCSELTTAPELPATDLRHHCYSRMFKDCTQLEDGPKLPASQIDPQLGYYEYMFENCSNLKSVTVNFSEFDVGGFTTQEWLFRSTYQWLKGTAITNFYVMSEESFNSLTGQFDMIQAELNQQYPDGMQNPIEQFVGRDFIYASTIGTETTQISLLKQEQEE